jgi:hypothetical protein
MHCSGMFIGLFPPLNKSLQTYNLSEGSANNSLVRLACFSFHSILGPNRAPTPTNSSFSLLLTQVRTFTRTKSLAQPGFFGASSSWWTMSPAAATPASAASRSRTASVLRAMSGGVGGTIGFGFHADLSESVLICASTPRPLKATAGIPRSSKMP